jgi:hypothetical protein
MQLGVTGKALHLSNQLGKHWQINRIVFLGPGEGERENVSVYAFNDMIICHFINSRGEGAFAD